MEDALHFYGGLYLYGISIAQVVVIHEDSPYSRRLPLVIRSPVFTTGFYLVGIDTSVGAGSVCLFESVIKVFLVLIL